jgi:D-erythronate 2-dehydrogenase
MATADLGARRSVTLPGLSATPGQMLDSLERLAGSAVRARVRCESDPRTTRIVSSWPGAFDVTRALALGFEADCDVDAIVRQYIDRYVGQGFSPANRQG